ncbi:Na+/H+ antiporter NhaC family protein [Christensenella tenuis]|uniref:Na+/H+ antiporter NhaC family protein n=1 Tax=Christensenella tenuis TaxID=2763033 RepID=A0ABR7EGY3_9FIRM|nr:Na+/H+ antiporter NhaC family protein [Christensenella tenuis]MBC5648938.1 Na+/H+ antiporter NhaC family protein [Christensenella tenuis]
MEKGKASALVPIGVFLALFIGCGVIFRDFYAVPAVVGFLIALLVAFFQNRKRSFGEKMNTIATGMGDQNVMIMCLVFILAGAFSGTAQAAGGVDSVVNFALSIMPPGVAVAGLFVIASFISLSMGTSVGTIAALVPIAVGISQKTGLAGALCVGAVVSGAMFGDNLSMISDTTIAAARTQGCDMKDKFRENFKIVLPAAVATFVIFIVLTMNVPTEIHGIYEYDFLKIVPYLAVLVSALCGLNVIIVLVLGLALSLGVGLFTGMILPQQMFGVIAGGPDGGGGIAGMYDITVISILVAGIIGLVKANGGIDFILSSIRKVVKTKKGAQLGIAVLSSAVDISTANNTVAIVIAGPIAKDISDEFGIEPKRTASLLDIFTSVWQGILPYGAQLLYASAGAAAVGLALTPVDIIPFLFYPILMGISALIWILFGIGERKRI